MERKILNRGKIGINKNTFHNNKSLISINEVEINRILLFDKTSKCGKGTFERYIGYRHKERIFSPLNIKLPQLTGYAKH